MSIGLSKLKLACLGEFTDYCVMLPVPLLVLRPCPPS